MVSRLYDALHITRYVPRVDKRNTICTREHPVLRLFTPTESYIHRVVSGTTGRGPPSCNGATWDVEVLRLIEALIGRASAPKSAAKEEVRFSDVESGRVESARYTDHSRQSVKWSVLAPR